MVPNDPVILLSFLNTKLRDTYPSLDDLCENMELDREELEEKLRAIGYTYDRSFNQFK